jgi:two-component system sensor histidine kinase and response regulator WspE
MSGDLSGFSIFDLYKSEAATHVATLNEGLLAIEADPKDLSHVDQLMRAAHSIKGAASIADIKILVDLAHAMEDCFVSVQKGEEQLTTARVDQLLAGVDVIGETSQLSESEVDDWQSLNGKVCQQLCESLRRPAKENAPASVQPAAPIPDLTDATAAPSDAEVETAETGPKAHASTGSSPKPETESASEDRTVPVNAKNLDRILRLAGESIVDSRHLQSMQQTLLDLQKVQGQFSELIDRVSDQGVAEGRSKPALNELRELAADSEQVLQAYSRKLERALWRSERTSTALYQQVIGSRMRPFEEGTRAFPRMIRDLSKTLGKKVSFDVRGRSVAVDRDILRKLESPLNHLLRNCVDHGLEQPGERLATGKPEAGRITMEARHHAGMLTIEVGDDGRGIDAEWLRAKLVDRKLADLSMAERFSEAELFEFLFLPGFSTDDQVTEVSGRGVGLDVVRSMVQDVSGNVRVQSTPGSGTTFTLQLPVTLSVIRAALAEISGELYAFPLVKLHRIERVPVDTIRPVQGKQQFTLDGASVGLVHGTEILGLEDSSASEETLCVVVIGRDRHLCGIVVDRFIGEQDLVVRPLDPRLGNVPHISAAALTEDGQPLLIVDVDDLLHSIRQLLGEGRLRGMTCLTRADQRATPRVLVVDDSVIVRETERHLLVGQGYQVDVAVDGRDGWHALQSNSYDLLVSDIDMPRMNGIELVRTVRQDPRLAELPIIIVSYKDREEDRVKGFEAGANAYLTKGSFHDNSFTKTVADLIGEID